MATTGKNIIPVGDRLIDRDPNVYILFKKVLVLGMPRTGTNSMTAALKKLGMNPYLMMDGLRDEKRDLPLWVEAAEAKFLHTTKAYGRDEFDKLTGHFDAIIESPPAYFAEDFIKAYSTCKVILASRDPDHWLESSNKSAFAVFKSRLAWFFDFVDPAMYTHLRRYYEITMGAVNDDLGGAKTRQAYVDHYECIKSIVPEKQLLELHTVSAWEPLCSFLGVPVPDESFPVVDQTGGYKAHWKLVRDMVVYHAVKKASACFTISAVLAAVFFGLAVLVNPLSAMVFTSLATVVYSFLPVKKEKPDEEPIAAEEPVAAEEPAPEPEPVVAKGWGNWREAIKQDDARHMAVLRVRSEKAQSIANPASFETTYSGTSKE